MGRGRPKHDDTLTPREWQVLALIGDGLTNEQIARRLGVSENTAKYHVAQILAKLDVPSREAAAAWGVLHRQVPRRRDRVLALLPAKVAIAKAGLGTVGLATAVGCMLLFVVALRSRADDSIVGPLGTVAYVQDGDIWVQAVPDGLPDQVTTDGHNTSPQWSPSGTWLLYHHGPSPNAATWVIRADGTGRRQVASGIGATWLPTTDQVVFGQSAVLMIEDADGSDRRELLRPTTSSTERGTIASVLPSPDGRWLAYVDERWPAGASRPAHRTSQGYGWTYAGIWIAGIDGVGAREILPLDVTPKADVSLAGWSADGRTLYFASRPAAAPVALPNGLPLHAVAVDGGPARDLGVVLALPPSMARSPDGNQLAIVSGRLHESWTDKRIGVYDHARATFTYVTGSETAAISPAWSPDGRRIAYVGSPDTGPDGRDAALAARRIWLIAPDGTDLRQAADDASFREAGPRWSTDGEYLLFARLSPEPCDSARYSLWLLTVRDGSLREIAAGLPLFGTQNDRLVVGEVPTCTTEAAEGWVTDWLGHLSLGVVFDWWQPTAAPPP